MKKVKKKARGRRREQRIMRNEKNGSAIHVYLCINKCVCVRMSVFICLAPNTFGVCVRVEIVKCLPLLATEKKKTKATANTTKGDGSRVYVRCVCVCVWHFHIGIKI